MDGEPSCHASIRTAERTVLVWSRKRHALKLQGKRSYVRLGEEVHASMVVLSSGAWVKELIAPNRLAIMWMCVRAKRSS